MTGDKFSAHMWTQRTRRAIARQGVRALHIARQRLRPGGRIAILTSYASEADPLRHVRTGGGRLIGLRMFDRHAFVDLFSSAGLVDIEQHAQDALQFVTAGKPGSMPRMGANGKPPSGPNRCAVVTAAV